MIRPSAAVIGAPYLESYSPEEMTGALRRPCFPFPSSSSILAPQKFAVYPCCMCYHLASESEYVIQRSIRSGRQHQTVVRSPVVSVRRDSGMASIASKGSSCKVFWTVEAEVGDGECLYVSGDLPELGCWKPEMATQMFQMEHSNLWKAEIWISSGSSFKYNYFVKGASWCADDVIWRSGPTFTLLLPILDGKDRDCIVRDSWMKKRNDDGRSSVSGYVWGSWIEEIDQAHEPGMLTSRRDKDQMLESQGNGTVLAFPSSNGPNWKGEFPLAHEDLANISSKRSFPGDELSYREQPIEEPWLVLTYFPSETVEDDVDTRNRYEKEDETVTTLPDIEECQEPNEFIPDEDKSSSPECVDSTIILINSSICTMQRIAVLEDGKLVELLLQPVKTNVQCDSVYLGIITKLVPHMGGAFVNIGSARHSLMDIIHGREPFIFPPFHSGRNKKGKTTSLEAADGQSVQENNNEHMHDDAELVDDVPSLPQEVLEKHLHDDFEVYEDEDDADVIDIVNGFTNQIVHNSAEMEGFHHGNGNDNMYLQSEPPGRSIPLESEIDHAAHLSPSPNAKDSLVSFSVENNWSKVQKGTKIIVQVVKEGLGTKGPMLTAYPKLRSRFWVLITRCSKIGVSKKIGGMERTRLKVIAKTLQPAGFGLTVRTVAAGHSLEELQKDLESLLSTWKNVMEHAKSAALASDEGIEGAVPVILHRAMGQTLSVVQDYFNDKVTKMVVDSPRTFHEVTSYLQEIAPDLCDRVELYAKRSPLFDEFDIEGEISNILNKRVPIGNGGSLVIEQTEALVSVDVNGGHGMFRQGNSQQKAILDVNLAAARQIARELRLRDIGGIIVVDFIDMADDSNKRRVYEEVKKAVTRDRSVVKVSELSKHGLMEITRKRVRPSVTFMVTEPCTCCHATGRVEALETSFSKIEQEICRLLAKMEPKSNVENPKSWPKFVLMVDHHMSEYLTSGKKSRLATLSSSQKVWILLKVARDSARGEFEVRPFSEENRAKKNQQQVTIPRLRPKDRRTKDVGKKVTIIPVKKWKGGR
ncbi:hypothetical protein MLD38_030063 [Melastoma candidum]|uniref:Uncharacterized protein n=1 Tax=Melastoma candidum TaxID=119954 RepID=A0ACB9MLS1_9MYRT|nr:hypothetical protein MLD38_030063 [Melastoma candidum]